MLQETDSFLHHVCCYHEASRPSRFLIVHVCPLNKKPLSFPPSPLALAAATQLPLKQKGIRDTSSAPSLGLSEQGAGGLSIRHPLAKWLFCLLGGTGEKPPQRC